jgi:hypothetical protein
MRITAEQLKNFLLEAGTVPAASMQEVFKKAIEEKKDLGTALLDEKLISEMDLQKSYAYILGIPFVDLTKFIIPADVLQVVPELIAKKYNIVAFEKNGANLKVAMLNPDDIQTIDFIKKKAGVKEKENQRVREKKKNRKKAREMGEMEKKTAMLQMFPIKTLIKSRNKPKSFTKR